MTRSPLSEGGKREKPDYTGLSPSYINKMSGEIWRDVPSVPAILVRSEGRIMFRENSPATKVRRKAEEPEP